MPTTDLATFEILVNGSAIDTSYEVQSILVENALNRITTATLHILDGSTDDGTFAISDSSTFVPGATLEIKLGFNSTNATVFKGIITGHAIQSLQGISSELVITAKDSAVKMTIARNNAYYVKQTDSDILSTLVGNYGGLSSDIDSTSYQWPELIQYYCTDWDFLIARAEVNGMYVTTAQNTVGVKKFTSGSSVATYTYGLDIYEMTAGMDARRQLSAVSAQGWDYTSQALVSANGSEPSIPSQGNLSGSSLSSATAPSAFLLSTTAPLPSTPLQSWADAQLARSRYAKILCSLRVLGTSAVAVGNFITLASAGARFNGDAFVSGVRHQVSEGQWYTTLSTGIDDNWYLDKVRATAPTAVGLLPGIKGIVNATVKAISDDPDSETRVQLNIPVIGLAGDGVWARLAQPYATSGAGFFWIPEVGDEVIVGFLNDDPGFPVILGSMYSSQHVPPYTPDAPNTFKAIYSKSKIYLEFDDVNKNLTITTPGKNKIIFSDQNQNITLEDQNSNQVVMSSSGIAMTSPKDVKITASGSVTISGTQGVTISSSADVNISATQGLTAKGLTVSVSADTEVTVKGSASAEFSSSGTNTIKGAIVMIN